MVDPRQPNATKAPPTTTTAAPESGSGDAGTAELQAAVDQEQQQGFSGIEVDPTPNENYTLQGVTSGAPTPETDAATKKAAQEHAETVRKQVTGNA